MRCAPFCFVLQTHSQRPLVFDRHQFRITANAVPESRKQHKHVRARQPLSSDSRSSTTVTSDESSSQSTAIWFPSSSRPTSQRNATESTGTHCRASLYRDVSGAGKPASALLGRPRPSSRGRGSLGLVLAKASTPIFFLSEHKGTATVRHRIVCVTSVDESF